MECTTTSLTHLSFAARRIAVAVARFFSEEREKELPRFYRRMERLFEGSICCLTPSRQAPAAIAFRLGVKRRGPNLNAADARPWHSRSGRLAYFHQPMVPAAIACASVADFTGGCARGDDEPLRDWYARHGVSD